MAIDTLAERLSKLAAKIARLETTLTKLESLGIASMSAGGISRNFMDYEVLSRELDRARSEYARLQAQQAGIEYNPNVKYVVTSGE